MARSRIDLQHALLPLAKKVWFVRPPDNKMVYPCIIYRLSNPNVLRANNHAYVQIPRYNVIYISQEVDDNIIQQMLDLFPTCSFDREYESDGLFHYSFMIYY